MKDCKSDGFEIFVSNAGRSEWPRFLIQNSKNMFWDGRTWVKNQKDGLLYCQHEEAAQTITQIERETVKDKPMVKYEVPMICEVIGDRSLDREQLMDYLCKGARLSLTLPNPEGLVIQLRIDVNELKEVKNVSGPPNELTNSEHTPQN